MGRGVTCPFTVASQLSNNDNDSNGTDPPAQHESGSLPGHPLVSLHTGVGNVLGDFLKDELCCDDLEAMAPHLWMMSTQSSTSVRALHRHRLLGRQIFITESPRLHLVWYYDRVFVKPLPRYLMSHKFWVTYLVPGVDTADSGSNHSGSLLPSSSDILLGGVPGRAEEIRRAALGFVRTYRYLIRHESDLEIARDLGLLPTNTTWPRFCAFVSRFEDFISDEDVSGRYHYGDLRLSRLNFYCLVFLRRTHFEYLPEQYLTYFTFYFGPLLFIFGIVSVVLSAMQLELAVQEATDRALFATAWAVYRWFSVVVLLMSAMVTVYLLAHVLFKIINEWAFAIYERQRLRRMRITTAQAPKTSRCPKVGSEP
ncbi:hypothetical protein K4K52_004603 [Colletotrichum sp. SAR 10_76]|nr:hypothetical protein K4K52_004603 [Colletotrichum sp. SAR 10_76]